MSGAKNSAPKKEIKKMRYRILKSKNERWSFCEYFRTKKEAIAFQDEYGGTLQRKIGGEWFNC